MGDKSEIAYCGLFCGDCIIRVGRLGDLAGQLLKAVTRPEFQKLADGLPILKPEAFQPLQDHQELRRILGAMTILDCEKPCKEGGGTSACPIRECCHQKGYDGCWMCNDMDSCTKLGWLDPVHRGSHRTNLRIIREKGVDEFLAGEKHW